MLISVDLAGELDTHVISRTRCAEASDIPIELPIASTASFLQGVDSKSSINVVVPFCLPMLP